MMRVLTVELGPDLAGVAQFDASFLGEGARMRFGWHAGHGRSCMRWPSVDGSPRHPEMIVGSGGSWVRGPTNHRGLWLGRFDSLRRVAWMGLHAI